jgi:hypothetical protein
MTAIGDVMVSGIALSLYQADIANKFSLAQLGAAGARHGAGGRAAALPVARPRRLRHGAARVGGSGYFFMSLTSNLQ